MALRDWVQTSKRAATPATTATPDRETPQVVATVATVATQQRNDTDAPTDPAAEGRRARALAMLEANPTGRYVAIAEAGDPAVVGIAISGLAYGELEIPRQSYDGLVLLAMLERYGGDAPPTTH